MFFSFIDSCLQITFLVHRFVFDYKLPEQGGLEIFGTKPFANSGIFLLWKYYSGRPYTSAITVPPPAAPPVNDARFPSFSQVDLKLYKNFKIWQSVQAGLFVEIFNLTDERTLMDIHNTERYYLGTDDGDGTWNDPSVWSPPREVRFGFEISF